MPTEYEALVEALQQTDIPFKEYGWETRPEGTYGVVSLDFEAGAMNGDGGKQDRAFECSVDVFFRKLSDRATVAATVEGILETCCGDSWQLNSFQHETENRLFHIEWVCQVTGTITAPPGQEAQGTQESGGT